MGPGAWVAIVVVVLVAAFGLWRARTDGRFRSGGAAADIRAEPHAPADDVPWAGRLGERATLVQFSSAFCAPCRTTRVVLSEVAAGQPGVSHVEVDAEQHLDLVRRLAIVRTPTTLVLDGAGREVGRAVGAPTRQQVHDALAEVG